MRKMLALFAAIALAASGCGGLETADYGGAGQADMAAAAAWEPPGAVCREETLEFQRRLAMWYNLNLVSRIQDPGFRDAYRSILADTEVMGWVWFPEVGTALPIRHEGKDPGGGFIHSRDTAFPIGGIGSQPVLWLEGRTPGALKLGEGSVFQIHILDTVLTYRVTGVIQGEQIPEAAAGEDRCVLVFSGGGGTVVMGIRQ